MRHYVLPLMILGAIALAAVLAWGVLTHGHFRGPARAAAADAASQSVQRSLPPFRSIEVSGLADITLVQGAGYGIAIDGTQAAVRLVVAEVKGDRLVITQTSERSGLFGLFGSGPGRAARVTVTLRELDAIEASGAVKITAETLNTPALKVAMAGAGALRIDNLQTQSLRVSGSGAVKVELAGRATEQVVSFAGAGSYRALELVSDDTRASVSGAGKVLVNAKKTLKISLSGAGLVEYVGNPEVKQSVSGMGQVRRRDASLDPLHRRFEVALRSSRAVSATPPGWSRA